MKKPQNIVLATAIITAATATITYVYNHKDEVKEGISKVKKYVNDKKQSLKKDVEKDETEGTE